MGKKEKREWTRSALGRGVCLATLVFFFVFLSACTQTKVGTQLTEATPTVLESEASRSAVSVEPSKNIPAGIQAPVEAEPLFLDTIICTADEYVNIRDQAGADGRIIGVLPGGDEAGVVDSSDGWVHISYGDLMGYVSMEYVVFISEPEAQVPSGDWTEILVNQRHSLPLDFSVDLADFEGGQVDARILAICEEMFADAQEDGVTFELVDAYRSRDLQSGLFEKKVESYIQKGYSREQAETEAATITARPDTSEHQTGLALDIVTPSYTSRDRGFAGTKAFKWLWANAANYGFTLRYAEEKTQVTGVIYEPWHWRFVGVEAAANMKETGECLEEYFGAAG